VSTAQSLFCPDFFQSQLSEFAVWCRIFC